MAVEDRLDIIIGLLIALTAASIITNITSWVNIVLRVVPGIRWTYRWAMKRKHLMDNAWPIRIILTSAYLGRSSNIPLTNLIVRYVLEPMEVPVTVQGLEVVAQGEVVPKGYDFIKESPFADVILENETAGDEYVGANGVMLESKVQSREYHAVFELPFRLSPEKLDSIVLRLAIKAMGKTCTVTIPEKMIQ